MHTGVTEGVPVQALYLGVCGGAGEAENSQCSRGTLQHQGQPLCSGGGPHQVQAGQYWYWSSQSKALVYGEEEEVARVRIKRHLSMKDSWGEKVKGHSP